MRIGCGIRHVAPSSNPAVAVVIALCRVDVFLSLRKSYVTLLCPQRIAMILGPLRWLWAPCDGRSVGLVAMVGPHRRSDGELTGKLWLPQLIRPAGRGFQDSRNVIQHQDPT